MQHRTKTHNGSDAATLEAGAEHAVENLRSKAAHLQKSIKTGVATTESAIQEHPWTAVGVAAGVGVGVGVLVALLLRRD
jgi:ElaB/YqjD/DUF883 family membrane-anchored ribosome-binding protein